MMRAFRVAYDGGRFHGFQRQPDVPTVEDTLLDALRALDVLEGDVPDSYAAAGRTDAGVSALAQTVAFDAPDWLSPSAFNSELPADVRAWASANTPADFHATHDADVREYTYHLYAPNADAARLRDALDRLAGRHDFHNFTPDETGTVRDLATAVDRNGEFYVLTFTAGGFARELVRRLVSLAHTVAAGDRSFDDLNRALSDERLTGPEGIPPAPALPLVLSRVDYPDLSFTVDENAAANARDIFESRRVEQLTGARVAAQIADTF